MRSSAPPRPAAATAPTVIPAIASTAAATAATAGPRTSAAARATRTVRCSARTSSSRARCRPTAATGGTSRTPASRSSASASGSPADASVSCPNSTTRRAAMIRGAVVHMTGEQPLLVDLEAVPLPGDTVLVCSNLRATGGQRPSVIDAIDSTFVIPYQHIRFVEIAAAALGRRDGDAAGGELLESGPEPEQEGDQQLLRPL